MLYTTPRSYRLYLFLWAILCLFGFASCGEPPCNCHSYVYEEPGIEPDENFFEPELTPDSDPPEEIIDDLLDDYRTETDGCGDPARMGYTDIESCVHERCSDRVNAEGDGVVDCEDPDCFLAPVCQGFVPPERITREECLDFRLHTQCEEAFDPESSVERGIVHACCELHAEFCSAPGPAECGESVESPQSETCMICHNGSPYNDYGGPGLLNPHPFGDRPLSNNISCTGCHGGNGRGIGRTGSHVPRPPEIGDDENLRNDPVAYSNYLTLVGIDKLGNRGLNDPYTVPDREGTFTNLDYLQFYNPGDLRVVAAGRGCGANGCHFDQHGQWVQRSLMATSAGILGGARFSVGVENLLEENRGVAQDSDTLADVAFRSVSNEDFNAMARAVGEVGRLVEQPERAGFLGEMRDNPMYDAASLRTYTTDLSDPVGPNRIVASSPLETLVGEQLSISCGNCHLGSAGRNDRYGDFRASGCSACHMPYDYSGRSRSLDPNIDRSEPFDVDQIAAPERPHPATHQIRSTLKFIANGTVIRGISDKACAGCHRGSNRTALQFLGVRLDQNTDLANRVQYPANPQTQWDTAQDFRFNDVASPNSTLHGRGASQHILFEDYDGDGRDDTPYDAHYGAGMACIDCHGSADLHGGIKGNPQSGKIVSRQDQAVAIRCESCHGSIEYYADYIECIPYGQTTPADCAVDGAGNALRHVTRDVDGNFWLVSRVSGYRHFVPQALDTIIVNNKRHPITQRLIYNAKASFAMGRADGNVQTGVGPQQADPNLYRNGFAHSDTMDCVSCHASWTNNCIGCHLATQYSTDPAAYFVSNITGERILLFEQAADFVYQSPVPFYLGINSRGKITKMSTAEKMFWRYTDAGGNQSPILAFSDRLGEGNNPGDFAQPGTRSPFPALAQNQMAAHSIRATVTFDKEGPSYCVGCHLNAESIENFGADYVQWYTDYQNNDYANFVNNTNNFADLQQFIGRNTGNQQNHPWWVHMVVGLGSGLFWFDANGCPVNPLDTNANRMGCNGVAPADQFNPNKVAYDLDRLVQTSGVPNASSGHPRLRPGVDRRGASNPLVAGPLGSNFLQKLADPNTGRILDSWLDADGNPQGNAVDFVQ